MKKFSYRMENILRIQTQLEEQQKIQFAIANNKLEEERHRLVMLTVRKRKYERALTDLLKDTLDLRKINEYKHAINVMKSNIRDQMLEVAKAEKQVEREREKLNELRAERKTHEKLKEYAFEEYKVEFAREESREIDQTVTYNYSTRAN